MALNLKGLLTRKKKARAVDDDDSAAFFTGASLGPGLGNDHDDAYATDAGGAPTRGFDDLHDDDWGSDDDEDDRPRRRRGGAKRLALFAGIGLGAAAIAGGAAWWVLTGGHLPGAEEEQHAALGEGASAPMGSGGRVSLPMPAAPGLESAPPAVVVDPTAATDKSAARRPWLAEGAASETAAAPEPASHTAEPTAPAPAEPASAHALAADERAPAAPEAHATAPQPAAPAETPPAPQSEPQVAAVTPPAAVAPVQVPAPSVEDVKKPDTRDTNAPPPTFEALPTPPKAEPLKSAPVSDLVRNTPAGPLPIAAPDGRKAWNAYAKPFEAPAGAPRVAIVVADLGLLPVATDAAIDKLPAGVTLAFSPYGFEIPQTMQRAREAGHEVMVSLPMETLGFPAHDPGPLGLSAMLPVNDNLIRLNTIMTKGVGYVGLLGRGGQTFTEKTDLMKPVLEAVSRAGLLYVQPAGAMQLASYGQVGAPTAVVDLNLDEKPFRSAISARLQALEKLARERGSAVAVIEPTPLAFQAVTDWLAEAQGRGIALAPVSAVVRP